MSLSFSIPLLKCASSSLVIVRENAPEIPMLGIVLFLFFQGFANLQDHRQCL